MTTTHNNTGELLRQRRLRITAPRVAILRTLLEAGCPLSGADISVRMGDDAPDKTTIYRTLMTLTEANIVHKAFVQHRQWYFESAHHCSAHQCHPHFTCVRCHRTECLHNVTAPLVTLPDGLTMHRQQIRIEGLCAACSTKE